MKREMIRLWAAALILCGIAAFLWWQNSAIQVTYLTVRAPVKEGVRIVHLSDLHGKFFGLRQERLARAIRAQEPDVIVITGDYFDATCDERAAIALIEALRDIAPIYCVTGNHEWYERNADRDSYKNLRAAFEELGAQLLRGKTVWLTDEISLTGADDFRFLGSQSAYSWYIERLGRKAEGEYRILLAHQPNLFRDYVRAGFDLTLSGHAHGGQIRLPFIGGLFSSGEGFLPKYTSGLYEAGNGSQLIVSRGLGNSVFVPRLFNRPEVGVIDIAGKE